MPGLLAPSHIIILGLVLLLIFGPKRLPEMGRSLGHGMREFKNSVAGEGENEPQSLPAAEQPAAHDPDTAHHLDSERERDLVA
ncbi:MAG: twin-arginine translocase TatA/TatE family subunit [Acetobacteraceae bacterium]